MFAMRRKEREQREARELRSRGWSVRRIAGALGVAVSSVSVWVRDIAVPVACSTDLTRPEPAEQVPEAAESKRCGRCRRDLPVTSFNRHPRGRQWWCRDCFSEYFKARGKLHRQQANASRQRRRAAAKAFIDEYLRSHPCIDCGERDLLVLEFDHVGPKAASLSVLAFDGMSLERIRKEIAACEVVCVNCHRCRSAERGGSWRLDPASIERNARLTPGERRNMAYVRDLLFRARCVDCGRDELIVLEFDHVGTKRASVIVLARRGCSLEVLRTEIARCEVRCGNCHRRKTLRERKRV
jgi:hypothetical protein